jgi:hypothetical protein
VADLQTLFNHAVSTLLSAGGTFVATVRMLTAPIIRRVDALEAQTIGLLNRIDMLERAGARRQADYDGSRQSGSWVAGMAVEERLAETERRLAELSGGVEVHQGNVRSELERLGAELSDLKSDMRGLVTDEEHQAFAVQMQDRVHKIAETLGYLRGRLRSPSK